MYGYVAGIRGWRDTRKLIFSHYCYYRLTVGKSLGYASQALKSAPSLWRSGRVVDGAALEMLCRATYRGFESHLLRI
jgi:hypothetical protein